MCGYGILYFKRFTGARIIKFDAQKTSGNDNRFCSQKMNGGIPIVLADEIAFSL
jgi:hypothetical protein